MVYTHDSVTKFTAVKLQETKRYILPANKKIVRLGALCEWRETHCHSFIDNNIDYAQRIFNVKKSLKAKGYYHNKLDNNMDKIAKKALCKFQKDNGLPIGSLDMQTLKALGIHYQSW